MMQTKDRIIDFMISHIKKGDCLKTIHRTYCSEAGIEKSTVYEYFENEHTI